MSRTQNSSKARDAGVQSEPAERASKSANEPGAGRSARKDAWIDGFLTSTGAQMPLFVRQANGFKHP